MLLHQTPYIKAILRRSAEIKISHNNIQTTNKMRLALNTLDQSIWTGKRMNDRVTSQRVHPCIHYKWVVFDDGNFGRRLGHMRRQSRSHMGLSCDLPQQTQKLSLCSWLWQGKVGATLQSTIVTC